MLRLYNSLKKKKEIFKPLNPPEVGLYTCGPTVYDYAHIGNLRTYIFADVLRRVLEYNGYKVKQVMNITDVGHLFGDRDMGRDKVEESAKKTGKTAWEIAEFYTKVFIDDIEHLNILKPQIMPKATDQIKEQLEIVKKLEENDFAYKTSDGVYFDTSKLKDYGKMATVDLGQLREGARVEKNPEKKNPTDFVLWKFSPKDKKRQMEWDSPWGVGFPGWHVECSAMSAKYLGQPFDIHTGGVDHINVHHTNEIAQSEGAYGKPLARFWLHGAFLLLGEHRMGKSKGNLMTFAEIKEKGFEALAYRYLTLTTHYRSELKFTLDSLKAAQNAFDNLRREISSWEEPSGYDPDYDAQFLEAVNDDLDMPKALSIVWDLTKSDLVSAVKHEMLLKFDSVLGLRLAEIQREKETKTRSEKVQKLIEEREKARKAKDWEKADKLREKLQSSGIIIEDTPQGPKVKFTPQ